MAAQNNKFEVFASKALADLTPEFWNEHPGALVFPTNDGRVFFNSQAYSVDETFITGKLTNHPTFNQIYSELSKYQSKLTAGTGISINDDNTISVTLEPELYEIVAQLPDTTEAKLNKIYIMPNAPTSAEGYKYNEYICIERNNVRVWELIGYFNADINLANYYTKDEIAGTYATKEELDNISIIIQ